MILTKKEREKLLKKKPVPDVPEMKEYPLNVYTMALCNMCLKHMKKLGVSESIGIHISTENGTHGIIRFVSNNETYSLKNDKWTKLKEV